MSSRGNVCVVCRKDVSANGCNKLVLVSKGRQSLLDCSLTNQDQDISAYLHTNPESVYVHEECRKQYLALGVSQQKRPTSALTDKQSKYLRSDSGAFDWKTSCFLCGDDVDRKHPKRTAFREAKSDKVTESIRRICDERQDKWAFEVKGRLLTCGDLHAADAVYHVSCYRMFSKVSSRHMPNATVSAEGLCDTERAKIFDVLCNTLENTDCEVYTVSELVEQMEMLAEDADMAYSERYMKQKLQERYGDRIFFADVSGRKNVVCFRNMAQRIINEKWYAERDADLTKESERVVDAAAKLIKAEIRESMFDTEEYPVDGTVSDRAIAKEWVPPLLRKFLKTLIMDELKLIGIGHSIVQASRPRSVISPVLLGLGVSIDHICASKMLLQLTSRLGFTITADEVVVYKQSVAQMDDISLPASDPGSFTQWSADNVDHNVSTLDGQGSFHGMGIMSMTVQCAPNDSVNVHSGKFGCKPIRRLPRAKAVDVVLGKSVPLHYYSQPNVPPLLQIQFQPIDQLCMPYVLPASVNDDLLWEVGWFFQGEAKPRSNWFGFMQNISAGSHIGAADIHLLPIIDMDPGNKSCILSTLLFIVNQAKLLNVETPCVTLDQPLWIKAVEVVTSEGLNVVCRMGMFHMIMSFLGSIGAVMSGSGIDGALECCYGSSTVSHMLSGKAVTKAIRGHMLMESALHVLLMRSVLDVEGDREGALTSVDVSELRAFYDSGVSTGMADEPQSCLVKLDKSCRDLKESLASTSRTAKLWVQYMDYVETLKHAVRAERTSDWNLHLVSVSQMLSLLAATGHNHYAKCARLYLQMMLKLRETHPWLEDKFQSGCHSVRRSNRFWAGLSTDLAIEQVMMKAVKGHGGLTHGRGITESVRTLWVRSLHQCASVYSAVKNLTGVDNETGDGYHPELSPSRSARDFADLNKILEWFASHNPLDLTDCRLRSISTGLVATDDDSVNCDMAEEVGHDILKAMDERSYGDVVMRKSSQVRTLIHLCDSGKVGKQGLLIDPKVLFSRLLIVVSQNGNAEACFSHELTAVPTSLFKGESLRKTNKAALAKEITKSITLCEQPNSTGLHVLDGGCLLHKVVWPKSGTYGDVLDAYAHHVSRHYSSSMIVFDGYSSSPSTKDAEHVRRATQPAPVVSIAEHLPVYANSVAFLSNQANKKSFIELLMRRLQGEGCTVLQATDDADTLIVKTALDIASSGQTVTVVADDTDILVLLLYHFRLEIGDIYMLSEITRVRAARKAIYEIRALWQAIGETAADQLLAVHAISGCDTTSALFGLGKGNVFRKVKSQPATIPMTQALSSIHASQDEIVKAGLQLLVLLYGGKPGDTLNHLRYAMYMNMIATGRTQLRPERLPPTERAAYFHILRVHLQIVHWKTLMAVTPNPENWGWTIVSEKFVPVTTDKQPAPDEVLSVITCRCKTNARKPCSSLLCSCRKHGLHCVAACKHCYGEECENVSPCVGMDLECEDSSDDDSRADDDSSRDGAGIIDSSVFDETSLMWIDEEVVES